MLSTRRGGSYLVLTRKSRETQTLTGAWAKERGGRWNEPSSFRAVYARSTLDGVRAFLEERFKDLPYKLDELADDQRVIVLEVDVPSGEFADVVSDAGCTSVGLPTTYPREYTRIVPEERCRPIGMTAHDAGLAGVTARAPDLLSPVGEEELAWFRAAESRLTVVRRLELDDWY